MNFRRILLLAALSFAVVLPAGAKKRSSAPKAPKYVFYLIGDGMGINNVYGTQLYNVATGNGPEELNFLSFPVRTFITTHSSSALVTDSAAAGTALSTGVKTANNYMGVDADANPASNLSEWAHAAGSGAGVATSVGVNHATPAAFYAHTKSRSSYTTIAEQLIAAENIDFAAGAGFLTERKGPTAAELEAKAAEAGISVRHGKDQFNKLASMKGRVLCLSADPKESELKYAIDRRPGDTQLLDFTRAGIDYLYGHFKKKGFFFMIEGGKIDYAGHNDDGATFFQETNDFAKTIDAVLAFYDEHPDETLIVVTADHETGGAILGAGGYSMSPELLGVQKCSENELTAMFRELVAPSEGAAAPSWEVVKDFFKENLGLWDSIKVPEAQEAEFRKMYESAVSGKGDGSVVSLYAVNSKLVSDAIDFANKAAGYSWAHGSHSGSPVGLYVKGAAAMEFLSCTDNTDVPVKIAEVAGYKR